MAKKAKKSERPKIRMRREGNVFVPLSRYDWDILEHYNSREEIVCELHQPISASYNRWFHGLLKRIADGMGCSVRALKNDLLREQGLYERGENILGEPYIEPMSTADMTPEEWHHFVEGSIQIIVTKIIPGADPAHLYEEAAAYVGEDTI